MSCQREAPAVAEAYKKYGDKVQFIGVAGRDDQDAMQDFISRLGVDSFTHIADSDGDVWARFGVVTQPSFAFIQDDGSTDVHVGRLGLDKISDRIDELLAS